MNGSLNVRTMVLYYLFRDLPRTEFTKCRFLRSWQQFTGLRLHFSSFRSIAHTHTDKKDYGCVQMFQLAVTAAVETPCRLYILAITGPRTALLWHSETFPVTGLVSCDLYRCTLHCRGLSLTLKFSGIYDETSKLSGTD